MTVLELMGVLIHFCPDTAVRIEVLYSDTEYGYGVIRYDDNTDEVVITDYRKQQ